jgi:uncharacterized protein
MLQLLLVAIILYLGLGIVMWLTQARLIFPVPKLPADLLTEFAADRGIQVVHIPTKDGVKLYAWHNRTNGTRLVIFFHGNAETLAGAWPLHQELRQQGWDVLSFAYRGYPGSEGSPSERGLQRDALAVWTHATSELGYAPDRIILHGRSLGGGVIGTVMNQVEPAALVLQSTFRSIRALASSSYPIYPVSVLLKHPFDTEARAPSVQVPVLVLHSSGDALIPVSHAQALAPSFPRGEYLEVPHLSHNEDLVLGDVNALRRYRQFLEAHVPANGGDSRASPPANPVE